MFPFTLSETIYIARIIKKKKTLRMLLGILLDREKGEQKGTF